MEKNISSLMDIEFDSEPVYDGNDKYIKKKIKTYRDKTKTNFSSKNIRKENAPYKCLLKILLLKKTKSIILKYS